MLEIHPIEHIPEIGAGACLADILQTALKASGLSVEAGDILVITQKIVSKAEGRHVDLATVEPGARAIELASVTGKDARLVELALQEASDVVRAVPGLLITRHRLGLVMANSGIDKSNLGPRGGEHVLLLPEAPDASARQIRETLEGRLDCPLPVVITDSFGRPWRHGVTGVAIGASGLPVLLDRRGERDRDGRSLEVTQVAIADLVACAAMLVTGEGAEGIPAVLVRGVAHKGAGAACDLIRPLSEDQFQ